MPDPTSSRDDDSCEPATAHPLNVAPRSDPPLERPPSSPAEATLPPVSAGERGKIGGGPATIGESSPPDTNLRPLRERDRELIDFLVRKAIEKCMPPEPNPSLSMLGTRQRSARRNVKSSKPER